MKYRKMDEFMREAFREAKKGLKEGGIPIGSVLVYKNKIIGRGHNQRVQKNSVILHAEMDCLEDAGRMHAKVYSKSTLYTTLSPCDMCAGTILLYGIKKVVIGENKNFRGNEDYLKKRGVKITILDDSECIKIMNDFIAENPKLWKEDIGI